MVVHVESEREAVGEQDAGEEIEVREERLPAPWCCPSGRGSALWLSRSARFGRVKTGAGVDAGGVIEDVEEDLLLGLAGQPGVRGGVVLPEGAEVAGLPAAHGLAGLLVTGVRGELVSERPTAHAGAVGLELEAAPPLFQF